MDFTSTEIHSLRDDPNYVKCPRCLHYHTVKENFGHLESEILEKPELAKEKLCDGCSKVIVNMYPEHPSAPFIIATMKKQLEKYTNKLC